MVCTNQGGGVGGKKGRGTCCCFPACAVHYQSMCVCTTSLRETCCAGHVRGMSVARGACFRHFCYPGACCCVAVLTQGNGNLLPFVSQLAYFVLQTTHVLSKHGWGLWIFGLLGRIVELKQHHVLPMQAFMWW